MLDAILTGDDILVDDHFVGLCLECEDANSAAVSCSWTQLKRPAPGLSVLYKRWKTRAPSDGSTRNRKAK